MSNGLVVALLVLLFACSRVLAWGPGHDHVNWSELARDLVERKYAGTITAELIFPRHLTDEEIRAGYYDLSKPNEEWPTLSHRLAQQVRP